MRPAQLLACCVLGFKRHSGGEGLLGNVRTVVMASLWCGSMKPYYTMTGCCATALPVDTAKQALVSRASNAAFTLKSPQACQLACLTGGTCHGLLCTSYAGRLGWTAMRACMLAQPCKYAHHLFTPPRAVCKRVGGGFGGKVSRPNAVAIPAALAAQKTGQPVRFVLSRNDDFRLNGGGACAPPC